VTHDVLELGQFVPQRRACEELAAGQVGYLVCNIKDVKQVHIGDTVTIPGDQAATALPGYKPPQRMRVLRPLPQRRRELRGAPRFVGEARHQRSLVRIRAGEQRGPGLRLPLRLSRPLAHGDHPAAAGAGSRSRPRADGPNVTYQILKTTGETMRDHESPGRARHSARSRNSASRSLRHELPRARWSTSARSCRSCTDRRGMYRRRSYLSPTRAMLSFDLPLAEVIYDMHDKLEEL